MPEEFLDEMLAIARAFGFGVACHYCTAAEMTQDIRELATKPEGEPLTDIQRRALLENLRRIILRTASSHIGRGPVDAQSRKPRWKFLVEASPSGADTFVAVLRYLDLDVPAYLVEESR